MTIKPYVKLCRPEQYIKNLFIFAPPFFAHKLVDSPVWPSALLAFLSFCLAASAVYIFNDWRDRESDRLHPVKRQRPLAAGTVSSRRAWFVLVAAAVMGLTLAWLVNPDVFVLVGVYVMLNLVYTLWLKHVALVDISVISLGFVLRLFVGSQSTAVPLSKWIIIITFLLALFLALAKRRNDVWLALQDGRRIRKSTAGYNLEFLNGAMALVSAIVLVAYLMYTVSPEVTARVESEHLYFTAFFVLLGFLRYMQLTFVHNLGGSPTRLVLRDRFLQVIVLGWVATFAWLIY
jgi:4-hydroxybenzoate polyprenyltransferase